MSAIIKQFRAAKKDYPGVLLLFLVGDFYETFDADAEAVAETLRLALTRRDQTPMVGFPVTSLKAYLVKLLRAGHRVAVCERVREVRTKTEVQRVVL